jgi:hypothetical protein
MSRGDEHDLVRIGRRPARRGEIAEQGVKAVHRETANVTTRRAILVPLVHTGGLGSRIRVSQPKPPTRGGFRVSAFATRTSPNVDGL